MIVLISQISIKVSSVISFSRNLKDFRNAIKFTQFY